MGQLPWLTACAQSWHRERTEYDGISAKSFIFRTLGAVFIPHHGAQLPWQLLAVWWLSLLKQSESGPNSPLQEVAEHLLEDCVVVPGHHVVSARDRGELRVRH